MPRDELDAFVRLYLNHGLLATWDGVGHDARGLRRRRRHARQLDDRRSRRRRRSATSGRATTASTSSPTARPGPTTSRRSRPSCRSSPVPRLPPKDEVILRGAERLGWEAAPARRNAAPTATTAAAARSAAARGAKQSGIRVHLARALRRRRPDRAAGPGHAGPHRGWPGGRRRGQRARCPGSGRRRRGSAGSIARAPGRSSWPPGALRTPAILQASGLRHPAIGRHLRLHPVPVVAGRMPMPVDMWRGPMQGARSLEFVAGGRDRNGYVIESAPGPSGPARPGPALGGDRRARRARCARSATSRRSSRSPATAARAGSTLTRAGRVRLDYRSTRSAWRRSATRRCAWRASPAPAGAGEIVVAATPAVRFEPVRGSTERRRGRVRAVRGSRSRAFDFRPEPRIGLLGPPDGHGPDGGGAARPPVRSARPGPGTWPRRPGDRPASTSRTPRCSRPALGVNPMLTVMALARRVARTVLAEA